MKGRPLTENRVIPLLALLLFGQIGLTGCTLLPSRPVPYPAETRPSGLVVQDILIPVDGPVAAPGDRVTIHYEGRLADGNLFDSSLERGEPITFEIGAGQVPAGLDEGIVGMRLFGRRELVLPSSLGYGEDGRPPRIPGGAVLTFMVEVYGIEQTAAGGGP